MVKKEFALLTAEEVINELKKSPEESLYFREVLFSHLACLAFKADTNDDSITKEKIIKFVNGVIRSGSKEDKHQVLFIKEGLKWKV